MDLILTEKGSPAKSFFKKPRLSQAFSDMGEPPLDIGPTRPPVYARGEGGVNAAARRGRETGPAIDKTPTEPYD